MKFDLHIHSIYSYDSYLRPENIIKIAKKRSLNGIAVTDHNTIKGGLTTHKINEDPDFTVIIGEEIKTEYGDVMGFFLTEEVENRNFLEVIDEIKSQDGLTALAHPYRQYQFPEKIIDKVDLMEVFNARGRDEDNKKSYELQKKYRKPVTAGSDAHSGFEIGNGWINLEGDLRKSLLHGKNIFRGKITNYYLSHGLSVINENIKKIIQFQFY